MVSAFTSPPYFWKPINMPRAECVNSEVTVEPSWLMTVYANKVMTTVERHLMGLGRSSVHKHLVSVTWVGVAVSLRVVGVVHVLDVLGK